MGLFSFSSVASYRREKGETKEKKKKKKPRKGEEEKKVTPAAQLASPGGIE